MEQTELFEPRPDLFPAVSFFDGLRPEPMLTVSAWADLHRKLDPKASAEPGQWRTDRTPYLREPMDMLSANNPMQEVIMQKGAQVGATEAGNNWLGYIIDNAPAPCLMVMPTAETVARNSKLRIDPMIEATPRLQSKVKPARSRDSGNTTNVKEFPGGVLVMTGANSAVGLRSMPVRDLFLDEIDGYPHDLDGEGSPIDLAVARTRTFTRRKIFEISTPTIQGLSAIEGLFLTTDQRYFFVPCPACNHFQIIKFERLKWEKGKPQTAVLECEDCGHEISERHKLRMLSKGVWRATKPENASPVKVGYHISALYSPWFTWAEIARLWIDAKGKANKLKTFVNTILGESWKAPGESPDWELIYGRREAFDGTEVVPWQVGVITAGADVQKDRIECEVVGWGADLESWSLGYFVLAGDTAAPEVWLQLAELLGRAWVREDGQEMKIRTLAVDTGYNTQHVYKFARRYPSDKVIPIKGQEKAVVAISAPKALQTRLNGKRSGTARVWSVGVSILKSELYGWLKLQRIDGKEVPPGYCHFPTVYDDHYFKMLTAEQYQYSVNGKTGAGTFTWVKKYERNEALDCRVYARAAASMLNLDKLKAADWARYAGTPPAGYEAEPEEYDTDETAQRPAPVVASAPAKPVAKKPVAKKRESIWKGR